MDNLLNQTLNVAAKGDFSTKQLKQHNSQAVDI